MKISYSFGIDLSPLIGILLLWIIQNITFRLMVQIL
ncbi:MAG: hypothetical protein N4R76_04840 [Lactobacillus iners]|nr:hypothetical protein [Lactobacillus iners]MCT7755878.1 hypothetical protein [Lactobacillus iners]